MNEYVPWLTVVLLGAYHGLNPGMGWLFAVALGLQERSRAAVLRAFGPIALGHAASIALVVVLVGLLHSVVAPEVLRIGGAVALILFGLYKLLVPLSHPRWVGLRVSGRDLVAWSFLMASAHGAGLMLVPVLTHLTLDGAPPAMAGGHGHHATPVGLAAGSAAATLATDLVIVTVHTLALFTVMGAIALVVYEKIGLAILRRAWFNLDRIWALALIAAGALTFVL